MKKIIIALFILVILIIPASAISEKLIEEKIKEILSSYEKNIIKIKIIKDYRDCNKFSFKTEKCYPRIDYDYDNKQGIILGNIGG